MAITKSAKKALRQNQRRRVKNMRQRRGLTSIIKEARSLIFQKKIAEAQNIIAKTYQALDKAAKTGLIKKNAASRKKSRMAKLLAKSR